jgi:hypothetical protein
MAERDELSGRYARPAVASEHNTAKTNLPANPEATRARVRRCHSIEKQLLTDMGGDPTQAQKILARNIAGLCVWCEETINTMINGQEFKIAELSTTINTLNRSLQTFGINRVPRDITPTLAQYIAKRPQQINGQANERN